MERSVRHRAHLLRSLGPLLLAGSAAGCGNAASDQSKIPFATHLTIVANPHAPPDAFYLPNPVQVHVGQIVSWTNKDTDPHDVTSEGSDGGTLNSGPIATGASYRWLARRPGTYHYLCTLHPEMHGEIIVHR